MRDESAANVISPNPVEDEPPRKPRQDLRKRLKEYALRILKLYDSLPKRGSVHIITHQLARSGTSPLAQY